MGRFYDKDGSRIPLPEWGRLMRDRSYQRVALSEDKGRGITVSTVWIGVDHRFSGEGPPVIFETMVFGPEDETQERYCTLEEAEAGHVEMCRRVEVDPAAKEE